MCQARPLCGPSHVAVAESAGRRGQDGAAGGRTSGHRNCCQAESWRQRAAGMPSSRCPGTHGCFFFLNRSYWTLAGRFLSLQTFSRPPSPTVSLSCSLLFFSCKRNSVSLWHLSRMKRVGGATRPLNSSLFNMLYEKNIELH